MKTRRPASARRNVTRSADFGPNSTYTLITGDGDLSPHLTSAGFSIRRPAACIQEKPGDSAPPADFWRLSDWPHLRCASLEGEASQLGDLPRGVLPPQAGYVASGQVLDRPRPSATRVVFGNYEQSSPCGVPLFGPKKRTPGRVLLSTTMPS